MDFQQTYADEPAEKEIDFSYWHLCSIYILWDMWSRKVFTASELLSLKKVF